MTALQKLASWTFGVTVLLVAVGGFTRGSGSGFGCEDRWPLCENGLLGGLLPRPEFHMVVEWTHRWFASISVLLVATLVVAAWLRYREERSLVVGSSVALVTILTQAGLGAVVVITELKADLVSLHLGVAMILLGLLAFITVETFFIGGTRPVTSAGPDPAWRRFLVAGALGVYGVIALGSLVHDQYVGGWPLVGGELVPSLGSNLVALHFGHRVLVGIVTLYLVYLAVGVIRRSRPRSETLLVHGALGLYLVNVGLGAAHVFTQVSSTGLVVAHLLVASLVWSALVAATALSRRADGVARDPTARRLPAEPVEAGA